MTEKEIEKKSDDVTSKSYLDWFDCFSSNASVYMPEFLKALERKKKETEARLAEELYKEQSMPQESAES